MIKDEQLNETEMRILEAAETEFLEKGFSGARTMSIAEAAGVTHAMLHYYFRTKEKLFDRILSNKIRMVGDLLVGSVEAADLPLADKLRMVIETHLDFIAANPNLPRFLVSEVFVKPDRTKSFVDKLMNYAQMVLIQLQKSIDAEVEKGVCRKVDARMLIIDIVSLNVFSYMAAPLINAAMGGIMNDEKVFLAQRKIENYDTIMRKLKP